MYESKFERRYKTGEVMITHTALVLLQALLDFPDATAPSVDAWERAARALSRGLRFNNAEHGPRKAMRRISPDWVTRGKFGRYVVVKLSPRGKEIVHRLVPVRVIGIGPYVSLAALGRRR